ncbi:MAG: GDCCVxC domain-containing (seleno)protein [Gemmatimonadales bacterium]
MIQTTTITCPGCGLQVEEPMPCDACVYFWQCPACAEVARPKPGDCCVFCSYGAKPCPPKQIER